MTAIPMPARLRIAGCVLAAALLAGCAGDQAPVSSADANHMFGLTSGPLPPPAPFVATSRNVGERAYPAVGVTPPERSDHILSMEERTRLEADLKRHSNPNAKPSDKDAFTNFVKKRKKKPLPPG